MTNPLEGGDQGATAVREPASPGAPKQQSLFPKPGAAVALPKKAQRTQKKTPTARFWVGTMPVVDGKPNPIMQCSKGIGFQRYQGTPEIRIQNNEATIVGNPEYGLVVDLTAEQYKMVVERVTSAVVRGNKHHDITSVNHPRFREYPGDRPLGKFLYMVRVGEKMPNDYRRQIPKPMIE